MLLLLKVVVMVSKTASSCHRYLVTYRVFTESIKSVWSITMENREPSGKDFHTGESHRI